jgi:polygalacturonase
MESKPAQKPSRKEDVLMVMRHLAIAALFIPSPALAGSDAPQSCNPPPDASVLVNVTETGAKGDGKTDDTAAIQAAIDKVAGSNGIVFLPDGIYMVAVGGKQGLNLKSDMTLKLSRGAQSDAHQRRQIRAAESRWRIKCLDHRRHTRRRALRRGQ